MRKPTITTILTFVILLLVAATVTSNYVEKAKVDSKSLPEKIEYSEGFQRWIINLKKRMTLEAEEFKLKDKNEVFNAAFLEITRVDDPSEVQEHLDYVATYQQYDDVAFSPDGRQVIDYRHEGRVGPTGVAYQPEEVLYYGLRDETLVNNKILSCLSQANCYFDRAYFLDNKTFVISEISRNNINRRDAEDGNFEPCEIDELCTYTFKLHFIDLVNNTRTVYESSPKDLILSEMIQFF